MQPLSTRQTSAASQWTALPPARSIAQLRTAQTRPLETPDVVSLSPRAKALLTATAYAQAAGTKMEVNAKLAIFRERFHEDAEFRGPVFGHLGGQQVFGKLTIEHSGGGDLRYDAVTPENVRALSREEIARIDPEAAARGEAWNEVKLHWVADYALGGRPIHNDVTTRLTIDAEGKIRLHQDDFDWQRWMDQAVPFVPEMIRHSQPFRKLANLALGVTTYFKG